jgi:hypothetical protein
LAVLSAKPKIQGEAASSAPAAMSIRLCTAIGATFLVVGLAAVFLGLTTKQQGGYSYRKADTARTAVG